MKQFQENIVVLDLRETYNEIGRYSFKVVFNPNIFRSCHDSLIEMFDAERNPIECEVKRWGRKMSCTFDIIDSMKNGVCVVEIFLTRDDGSKEREAIRFWVIK